MPDVGGVAGERLRSFIQRIERLEEEKKTIGDDIREIFAEAKSAGFDPKIMRQVIRLRKMETADRQEQEALLETYLAALGMTDIEAAIVDRGGRRGGFSPPGSPDDEGASQEAPAADDDDATPVPKGEGGFKRAVAKELHRTMASMGTPAELTEEERAKGIKAAFIQKDGTRMTIAHGVSVDG